MTSGPFLSFPSLFHHYAGLAWMPWVLVALDVALRRGRRSRCFRSGRWQPFKSWLVPGTCGLMTGLLCVAQAGLRLQEDGNLGLASVRKRRRVLSGSCLGRAPVGGSVAPTAGILRSGSRLASTLAPTCTGPFTRRLADLLVSRLVTDLPMNDAVRAILFESRQPFLESPYSASEWRRWRCWVLHRASGPEVGCLWSDLFFLVCALGRHTPSTLLLLNVPPFFMLRYPVKYLAAASLCWSLVAGLGVDAWMRDGRYRKGVGHSVWL